MAKRSYMTSDRRREALLGEAAEIVVRAGWSALTMNGLAKAAGVSRQLVYQYFSDLPELLVAVTRHLFERTREATLAIAGNPSAGDVADVAKLTFQVYLELPAAQRRALRALTAEPPRDAPELRRLRRFVRDEISALWTPGVVRETGLKPERARALAWMLTNAAWGLADLMEDGEISGDAARTLLGAMADAILRPGTAATRPRPKPTRRERSLPRKVAAQR